MASNKDEAVRILDTHERAIDDLHRNLAATPGVDKARLQQAADKYKAAHKQFRDDALGFMN
ncbi:MAG: hypothetical protein DLM50_06500 [Candidatus Meridianibacter frigidus]|nr:MAG: hypothetical protein DLM50_06500 [Candidatus Eremiobacteraeota bacterium]